jgi:S-adenosylmethionine-diacylgycerolhomoserine-N-methlytransferase
MNPSLTLPPLDHPLQRYYRLHSRFYDATRWTFLFGREAMIRRAAAVTSAQRILEVGCGTGANLPLLRRFFPLAEITGIDLSSDMLAQAEARALPTVRLLQQRYDQAIAGDFDLVLCSYTLSMINPGWVNVCRAAKEDLKQGGYLAVVDFDESPVAWFKRWMHMNHVRMDGHLRPTLRELVVPITDRSLSAYGGVWTYLQFLGKKTKGPARFPSVQVTGHIPSEA